jgi:hypothetical protein
MLMQRYSIYAATAFAMLIRRSQHPTLPVNELALTIIEHGPDPGNDIGGGDHGVDVRDASPGSGDMWSRYRGLRKD